MNPSFRSGEGPLSDRARVGGEGGCGLGDIVLNNSTDDP